MSMDDRSISNRTLATINVISSWVVNTFYNYLHQQAVTVHTTGRSASITDGYKFIVRQYLNSFNDGDGYRRNLSGLHKYYMDNTRYSSIPFDIWIKDILSQFVPTDYFSIMSNSQQDMTLRGILVGSITQFSGDVICTSMLDTLITNHENQTIVPIMKKNMTSALLFERQKLFQAIFKSSTGGSQQKPMEMMRDELTKLIEENVMLKHKNVSALKSLKIALSKMKERDSVISQLRNENSQLDRRLRSVSRPSPPPSPERVFTNTVLKETGIDANTDVVVNRVTDSNYSTTDVDTDVVVNRVTDSNYSVTDVESVDEPFSNSYIPEETEKATDDKEELSNSDGVQELLPGNSSTVFPNMQEFLDS